MVKRMLTFGNAMLTGVNTAEAVSPGRRTAVRGIRRGHEAPAPTSTKDTKGTKSVGHGLLVADAPCPRFAGRRESRRVDPEAARCG